jgi:hypothetical protein
MQETEGAQKLCVLPQKTLPKKQAASSTSPFRIGGRGSKQLSKAIEKSYVERGLSKCEPLWAFCSGTHPVFAKIVSSVMSGVIIQPIFPSEMDPNLYLPWEGHLWLAKKEKVYPIKVFSSMLSFMSIIF